MIQIRHSVTFSLITDWLNTVFKSWPASKDEQCWTPTFRQEGWSYERNDEGLRHWWSPSLSLSSDFSLLPLDFSSFASTELWHKSHLSHFLFVLQCKWMRTRLLRSPNRSASQEETLAEIEILLKHLSSKCQNGCQIGFLILEDSIVETLGLIPPKS